MRFVVLEECERCGWLYRESEMEFVVTFPATREDPEAGILVCRDCFER